MSQIKQSTKNGITTLTVAFPPETDNVTTAIAQRFGSITVNGQSIPTTPGVTNLAGGVVVEVVNTTKFGLPFQEVIVK